jgi:hypothetical protein
MYEQCYSPPSSLFPPLSEAASTNRQESKMLSPVAVAKRSTNHLNEDDKERKRKNVWTDGNLRSRRLRASGPPLHEGRSPSNLVPHWSSLDSRTGNNYGRNEDDLASLAPTIYGDDENDDDDDLSMRIENEIESLLG